LSSQFWQPNDTSAYALDFYRSSYPTVTGCVIEGDQDRVMRVNGGYGVSGATLAVLPQGGNITACTFKNSNTGNHQDGWIEVINTPMLNVNGCNFPTRDVNDVPDYIIYENDVVSGKPSSVILSGGYAIPNYRQSYDLGICNTRSTVVGSPINPRARIETGSLGSNYNWNLQEGDWTYVSGISTPITVSIVDAYAPDGEYHMIISANAFRATFSGQDRINGSTSPSGNYCVATVKLVAGLSFLTLDEYTN
jgi:hypothetical protein